MKQEGILRPDGLMVFKSGDERLDKIRDDESDKKAVIISIALDVAHRAAINYAERYSPSLQDDIDKYFKNLNKVIDKRGVLNLVLPDMEF